jgi:hypothetical protein
MEDAGFLKKKLTPTVMSALTTRWTGAPLAPLAGAYPPLISSKVKERWDEDALPVSSEVTNQTVKLIIKRYALYASSKATL